MRCLFYTRVVICRLDSDIEAKLVVRLEAALQAWTAALLGLNEDQEVTMDTEENKKSVQHKIGGDPKIMRTVHELRMQVRLASANLDGCFATSYASTLVH